jgi:hypothetical protein
MKVISHFSTNEIVTNLKLKTPAELTTGVLINSLQPRNYLAATTFTVTVATTECASETLTVCSPAFLICPAVLML